jgi:integrase
MPKRPVFQPLETSDGWMVSIPKTMSGDGKRRKRYFPELKEAEKFAKSLRGDYHAGLRGGTISPELAIEAVKAAEILAPYGLTLIEAARQVADKIEAGSSPETFRERYHSFCDEMETHWSAAHRTSMHRIPRWLPADFMDMRLVEITPEKVRDSLLRKNRKLFDSTLKARVTRIMAVVHGRGGRRRQGKFEILTDTQQKALLGACATQEERWVASLLLYAGIRPSMEDGEISRLEWDAIGKDDIYISSSVSKTGADRHIPITPVLRRAIKGHPKAGLVLPSGFRRRWQEIRREAGIAHTKDATRHTFASHFLAAFGDHAAKQAMGHTAGSDTLFRHYRRAVTEAGGKKYFGVD